MTESNKLGMPIVAVVDTNCDPDVITYVIPGNDDAIRSGALMCRVMAEAVVEGRWVAEHRATAVGKPAPAPVAAGERGVDGSGAEPQTMPPTVTEHPPAAEVPAAPEGGSVSSVDAEAAPRPAPATSDPTPARVEVPAADAETALPPAGETTSPREENQDQVAEES